MTELANEGIDQENWLARQVFAYYGLAIYWAQCIEHGMANIVIAARQHEGTITTKDEFETDYAAMLSKTMGQARNELLRRRPDLAEFEDQLTRAVKLRNSLAHGYFRRRAAAFMTPEGRETMARELEGAAEFLESVNDHMVALSLDLVQAMGGTAERLAEIYATLPEEDFGESMLDF